MNYKNTHDTYSHSNAENNYLLFSYYGIKEKDSRSEIIMKAAMKSYVKFARNSSFQSRVPMGSFPLEREVENILSIKIDQLILPNNLKQVPTTQEDFDAVHKNICDEILHKYEAVGGITYGLAQKFVNITLMNLVVIDFALNFDMLYTNDIRSFFHAPVDKYVLRAATANRTRRPFKHGLQLQAAPIRYDDGTCSVDWYDDRKSISVEEWNYDMYINFQTAIRDRLTSDIEKGRYQDVLDWSMNAHLEIIP